MVALVQRVTRARVSVDGQVSGEIDDGLLVLLGVHRTDTEAEAEWLAKKVANLRIFADEHGKMNRSLLDTGGGALVVSQFTLYGDARKGNRPSFVESAEPAEAERLYDDFVRRLEVHLGRAVQTGVFAAMMDVELVNNGPVTLWIERRHDG
jgi:D-aminoacyl-tRNA deacylase